MLNEDSLTIENEKSDKVYEIKNKLPKFIYDDTIPENQNQEQVEKRSI